MTRKENAGAPPVCRRTAARKAWIAAVAAIILVVAYFLIDPAQYVWMPKCPVKALTGYDCPGCGSQRLLHALLHGDIAGAWKANALLLLAMPYIALLALSSFFPRRFPALTRRLNSAAAIAAAGGTIIAWGLLRNFLPLQ